MEETSKRGELEVEDNSLRWYRGVKSEVLRGTYVMDRTGGELLVVGRGTKAAPSTLNPVLAFLTNSRTYVIFIMV